MTFLPPEPAFPAPSARTEDAVGVRPTGAGGGIVRARRRREPLTSARLLATTIGLAVCPAVADESCGDAGTTAAMVACADAALRAADADLNATWKRVVERVRAIDGEAGDGGDRVGTLRAAQRAWIAFRDAQCALEAAAWYGGTGAPLLQIGCLDRLTRARTGELDEVLSTFGEN